MKKIKSIMMMGFVLLLATLSKPAMALDLSSFTDVPNFSVVIGDSMYTLDYANNSANASIISAAVAKNKGDVFIKTDDSGWIKNSDGTQVDKGSVDISTIKYNNGIETAQQRIAVINITSTKLEVISSTLNGITTQTGNTTYQVLDQFGKDITISSLANGITFASGVGAVEGKNGILKLTANMNLLTFTSGIVITANDPISGVATSATLSVPLDGSTQPVPVGGSTQLGTLSDINLTTLTNINNKVLTAGNTKDVFYLGYTAKDISGNATTNYTLMKAGLIFQSGDYLTTSTPYVTAQLVQDPTNSTKGLIEVRATSDVITLDMPVVITAMTWSGKTSQISTILKK